MDPLLLFIGLVAACLIAAALIGMLS